jgi:hypothetical protein
MPSHGRNPSEHHGDPMIAGLPYSVVTGVRTISCMRKHSRRAISAVRSGELVYGQRNCARLQFPSNVTTLLRAPAHIDERPCRQRTTMG